MKFSDLRAKEVVRLEDGKKLGFIEDIIFDDNNFNVVALKIPISTKMFKKPEYIILDVTNIEKIGENVILVRQGISEKEENDKNEFYYSPKVFKRVKDKTINWKLTANDWVLWLVCGIITKKRRRKRHEMLLLW